MFHRIKDPPSGLDLAALAVEVDESGADEDVDLEAAADDGSVDGGADGEGSGLVGAGAKEGGEGESVRGEGGEAAEAVEDVEGGGEGLVDRGRVVAPDEMGLVAVPAQPGADLVVRRPAEHRRAGDLVAVEVQNR